jgi:hypothetical protein
MWKNILFFIGLSSFFCSSSFSQQFVDLNVMGEGFYRVVKLSNRTIDGSSTLTERWSSGQVKLKGNEVILVDSLNFDIYQNNLLFRQRGLAYCVSNQLNVEYFVINNSKFLNIPTENSRSSFFEILVDGEKVKLVKLYKCIIIEGSEGNGIDPGRNDRYKVISDYFSIKDFSSLVPFKNSKKELISLMADKGEDIKKYIKEQRLNCKNQADLIKIFNYYNSL